MSDGAGLDFEALFRAAPAGSVITGADDTILDVNEAFTSWTGLRREELLGTSFLRLLPVGDRILFSTRSQPLLELTGRIPESSVTMLGRNRVRLPAELRASRVGTDPVLTLFIVGPRRERSTEEAQLISAVHRAEDSDARRREAQDDLEHLANHDIVTGLPNRAALLAALIDSPSDRELTIHWIGLDHFRVINESLGRAAGDDILRVIAQRFRRHYDDSPLLARVGGDEFVVAVHGSGHTQQAERLLDIIAEPVVVEDLQIVISASIGVATQPHTSGFDPQAGGEALMLNAYTAMYEAKAAGRNRWKHVTALVDDSAINEIRLLGEIRTAIDGNQLRLEYQPQLDLRTGRLHGFEALIRWDHPERGLIPPSGFIDVAEKTGLISQIGIWACRTAIARSTELSETTGGAPTQMSVNISARQLGDAHFADSIASLLDGTGLAPACLTLELTETGLITDAPNAQDNLRRLHELGVRLSIDDFGTGNAGLTYLNDFPIDEIKIDRSYVDKLDTSPQATAVIVSCIELAHALNATVVAEGVETARQLERLTELGCDIAQGFHYSRPLRAEALHEFMS
jgi:diguanylate cyclase (GGDEF)-like protein/PAS domain S-box-containing protein